MYITDQQEVIISIFTKLGIKIPPIELIWVKKKNMLSSSKSKFSHH